MATRMRRHLPAEELLLTQIRDERDMPEAMTLIQRLTFDISLRLSGFKFTHHRGPTGPFVVSFSDSWRRNYRFKSEWAGDIATRTLTITIDGRRTRIRLPIEGLAATGAYAEQEVEIFLNVVRERLGYGQKPLTS
jgi:hypothetical protein